MQGFLSLTLHRKRVQQFMEFMAKYIPYLGKIQNLKDLKPDASIDLGDESCGDLVMELMKAVKRLKTGQILEIRATDPAASIDIAAWCAVSGNELVAGPAGENNAYFYIRKGETNNG